MKIHRKLQEVKWDQLQKIEDGLKRIGQEKVRYQEQRRFQVPEVGWDGQEKVHCRERRFKDQRRMDGWEVEQD